MVGERTLAKLDALNENLESAVEHAMHVSSVWKVGERCGENWY